MSTPPSITTLTPGERVRLARENLCLAMALYAASHQGIISASFFSGTATIRGQDGRPFDINTPLEVTDHESLLRTTGNQVRGAFALSALQTQRELEAAFGPAPDAEPSTDGVSDAGLWAARSVFRLIAHSVGRDFMAPVWRIPTESRRTLAIPSLGFTLDASELHGQEIHWGHLGGLTGYLDLAQFVSYCLDGADVADALRAASGNYGPIGTLAALRSSDAPSGSPVSEAGGYGSGSGRLRRPNPSASVGPDDDAPAGWIAPDGPPQPRISVASQASEPGPIDDFVATACSTGRRAMNLAGDLYASYAQWCLDHGYLAHSQRKFGLELRARGYERKRRGQGRHWWIGVQSRI